MIPTAITFVDSKFRHLAEEQQENFLKFNVNHVIVDINEVIGYPTELWIKLIDLTRDAIHKYGKVFRVDAEIRMHKSIPQSWIDSDNVLFYFDPLIKHPWYVAINTGQMILSNKGNGIEFLDTLKECILATIPPDNDTSLSAAGIDQQVEDEWPSAIAIRLSKISHVKEILCCDRNIDVGAKATRGLWTTLETVITHPAIHNWTIPGGGKWQGKYFNKVDFVNHFLVNDLKKSNFIANLVINRNASKSGWISLGAKIGNDDTYELEGWTFNPTLGLCAPTNFWKIMPKELRF